MPVSKEDIPNNGENSTIQVTEDDKTTIVIIEDDTADSDKDSTTHETLEDS